MNKNTNTKHKSIFTSVIFDFDYTLADSSAGEVECVNYALQTMKLPQASDAAIRATIGVSLPETFRGLTQGAYEKMSDKFVKLFIEKADEIMLDNIVLFDSVKPTIEQLITRGLTIGIVSTKYRYRIEAFLRREEIDDAFKVIVGGEDVNAHKPDPAGLRMAFSKLGLTSSRHCIYVGDSVVDAETANRADVPFVAVLSGVTSKSAFSDYFPLAVIENLTQLTPILLQD